MTMQEKNYLISETDRQKIAAILGEIPAKISIEGIDILRNLHPDIITEYPKENIQNES